MYQTILSPQIPLFGPMNVIWMQTQPNCLLSQEYIWDKNFTVASYLDSVQKGLTVTNFKRFTLRAE